MPGVKAYADLHGVDQHKLFYQQGVLMNPMVLFESTVLRFSFT